VLSLGLFADGKYGDGWNGVPGTVTGLLYGDSRQFAAQCIGTLTCFVFVFAAFFAFFKLVDVLIGNRVSAEVETAGLDLPEMGALAYPEFALGGILGTHGVAPVAAAAAVARPAPAAVPVLHPAAKGGGA
jgi:ammonia channel protein AmtB